VQQGCSSKEGVRSKGCSSGVSCSQEECRAVASYNSAYTLSLLQLATTLLLATTGHYTLPCYNSALLATTPFLATTPLSLLLRSCYNPALLAAALLLCPACYNSALLATTLSACYNSALSLPLHSSLLQLCFLATTPLSPCYYTLAVLCLLQLRPLPATTLFLATTCPYALPSPPLATTLFLATTPLSLPLLHPSLLQLSPYTLPCYNSALTLAALSLLLHSCYYNSRYPLLATTLSFTTPSLHPCYAPLATTLPSQPCAC